MFSTSLHRKLEEHGSPGWLEMPRKRINPKNRLQKELWHKIPKKGILSLTKVKLTVGDWWRCFKQVSHYISYTLLFLVIILLFLELIFVTLNSMFTTSIGFCKVYFFWNKLLCGNWLFLFLRNIDMFLFQVTKFTFPHPLFYILYFYVSLPHH